MTSKIIDFKVELVHDVANKEVRLVTYVYDRTGWREIQATIRSGDEIQCQIHKDGQFIGAVNDMADGRSIITVYR